MIYSLQSGIKRELIAKLDDAALYIRYRCVTLVYELDYHVAYLDHLDLSHASRGCGRSAEAHTAGELDRLLVKGYRVLVCGDMGSVQQFLNLHAGSAQTHGIGKDKMCRPKQDEYRPWKGYLPELRRF